MYQKKYQNVAIEIDTYNMVNEYSEKTGLKKWWIATQAINQYFADMEDEG